MPGCWNGANLALAGRYDEAIVQFRKALRMSPDLPFANWMLSDVFFTKAMYEESLAELKACYYSIGDREVEAALMQGYARSGYRGAMRRAIRTCPLSVFRRLSSPCATPRDSRPFCGA